jgi:hypothetical protein
MTVRVIPVEPLGHGSDCRICAAVDRHYQEHRTRRRSSGEPTTNRSATPRVGRSALVGSPESRDKALIPASPLRGNS